MSDGNVNPSMTKSNVIYVVVFSIALNNVILLSLKLIYIKSLRDETGAKT